MPEPMIMNWQGGEHAFLLDLGCVEALEEKFDCSAHAIAIEFFAKRPMLKWLREVLRLGLIGGGMERVAAARLVNDVLERCGPINLLPLASAVLFHGLFREGHGDEAAPGELKAGTAPQKE